VVQLTLRRCHQVVLVQNLIGPIKAILEAVGGTDSAAIPPVLVDDAPELVQPGIGITAQKRYIANIQVAAFASSRQESRELPKPFRKRDSVRLKSLTIGIIIKDT